MMRRTVTASLAMSLLVAAAGTASAQVNYGTGIQDGQSQPDLGIIEDPSAKAERSPVIVGNKTEAPAEAFTQVGLMGCKAELADGSKRLGELSLNCTFNRKGSASEAPVKREDFTGKLVGVSEPIAADGGTTLIFEVFSTRFDIPVETLAGDYDRSHSRNYEFDDRKFPYLFGGRQDIIMLKPRGEMVDALTASSTLNLTRDIG